MSRAISARALGELVGVEAETVRRWVRKGRLEPAGRTLGGHLRFHPQQAKEILQAGLGDRGLAQRAREIEDHVLVARAKLRLLRQGERRA